MTWTTQSNAWGPIERDRSNGETGAADGNTITIEGVQYAKGVGVHANSMIEVALNGEYDRFVSDIGIDDEVGNTPPEDCGSVIFRLRADGTLIYVSQLITGETPAVHVDVSVENVTTLRLEVDCYGATGRDHADWAGARLIKENTVPQTYDGPLGYTGEYMDAESELIYLRARY